MSTLKYEKYCNSHGAQPVHLEGPTMKLLEGHIQTLRCLMTQRL